ncbi:MAG: diphosphomevalonate decarboxylase [Bdellovibrionota bacterium]
MKQTSWEIESIQSQSQWARVFSPSNIALAKYWGKRDVKLNLPTNGSLSVTLKHYGSFTTVEFNAAFKSDELVLNGKLESPDKLLKVKRVLDEIRNSAGESRFARVQSFNNFPTAAGLASSASGLSAVTLAASHALKLDLSKKELSEIARKGSGSACRSLFGGFVEWKRGSRSDGKDSVAEQFRPADHWNLSALIAVANQGQKNEASTGGMEHTRLTSPYFSAWIESAEESVALIRSAIDVRDFNKLAELSESNCIRMHASAMAAFPAVFYWQPATLEIMQRVWALRKSGVRAFFTIDAGPNVVVITTPEDSPKVQAELARVSGVQLLKTQLGEGARSFEASEWEGDR